MRTLTDAERHLAYAQQSQVEGVQKALRALTMAVLEPAAYALDTIKGELDQSDASIGNALSNIELAFKLDDTAREDHKPRGRRKRSSTKPERR